jgi:hypothetical protein
MTARGDALYSSATDMVPDPPKAGAGFAVSNIGIRPNEIITDVRINKSIELGSAKFSKN